MSDRSERASHRVVIVGGGFGGLNCALGLKNAPAEVTLLDKRNFHLFQPLLYQVATGSLSPGDIAAPLRWVLRRQANARVLLAEVTGFDVSRRTVLLTDGEAGYDTLVVAPGAVNDYYGHDNWEAHAPGMKSVEEATDIRGRIFRAFEAAEREPDPAARRAWLRFVIVGAGPTGVELAGAISEIARDTLRGDFRAIRPEESEILLVEGFDRVLPPFPEPLSRAAERSLIRLGVRPLAKAQVTAVDGESVTIQDHRGEARIETRTVIWAAGVKANPLGAKLAEAIGVKTDRPGRVAVQPDLTVPARPEIFVIGDTASAPGPEGRPLPGTAAVALQQGRYVARAIRARLAGKPAEPFHYVDKGNLATIGRNSAVAEFGRVHLTGFIAWVAWLFVHLLLLVGFANRIVVAVQWGIQYLTFNRGARLITGRGETGRHHR